MECKKHIDSKSKMCKDADAILIMGGPGVGKSTLFTALAGYKLIKSSETGDYRAKNP